MTDLRKQHFYLIEAAKKIVAKRFQPDRHHVGAALRTKSGHVFSAVNLEARVGRVALCAEAVALGMAASAGDTDIETIVMVNRYGKVISPCGICRELIFEYAPHADVIVPGRRGAQAVKIATLLPNRTHPEEMLCEGAEEKKT